MPRLAIPVAMPAVLAAMLLGAAPAPAAGQDFAGTWINDQPANVSEIRLVLNDAGGGRYAGTLSGAGTTVPLEGVLRGATLTGRIQWSTGPVLLEAEREGDGLELLLLSPNPDGTPNYQQATAIAFVREGAQAASTGGPAAAAPAAPARDPADGRNLDGDPMSRSPLARQWAAHLIGKKLTQLESYGGSEGGYSRRRELLLCSTGAFHYRESNAVSADVGGVFGGGSGGDGGTGQWRVLAEGQLVGLDLRFADGRHWQVRLEQRDGATYVDGVRTYVTQGDPCP